MSKNIRLATQDKMNAVLNFITLFIQQNNYAPSVREIANGIGISSTSCIWTYLKLLKETGKITYKENTSRSIVILNK